VGATHGRVGPVTCFGLTAVLLAAMLGGCATLFDGPLPARSQDGMLVDADGMTLYTFDKDPPRARGSLCVAECARSWPPFAAPANAKPVGEYTPMRRTDGTLQWTYEGKPLYLRNEDRKPGDRTGDGVENLWRVARP
jgi:predicted lipoprotein with Yx(FWY)xxD motif